MISFLLINIHIYMVKLYSTNFKLSVHVIYSFIHENWTFKWNSRIQHLTYGHCSNVFHLHLIGHLYLLHKQYYSYYWCYYHHYVHLSMNSFHSSIDVQSLLPMLNFDYWYCLCFDHSFVSAEQQTSSVSVSVFDCRTTLELHSSSNLTFQQ